MKKNKQFIDIDFINKEKVFYKLDYFNTHPYEEIYKTNGTTGLIMPISAGGRTFYENAESSVSLYAVNSD